MVIVLAQMLATLATRLIGFSRRWMPTNRLNAWIDTDRGIGWGLPLGVALTVAFWWVGSWAYVHATTGESAWWWLPTVWAALNTIKFAHVALRSPLVWIARRVRRSRIAAAYRAWPRA